MMLIAFPNTGARVLRAETRKYQTKYNARQPTRACCTFKHYAKMIDFSAKTYPFGNNIILATSTSWSSGIVSISAIASHYPDDTLALDRGFIFPVSLY